MQEINSRMSQYFSALSPHLQLAGRLCCSMCHAAAAAAAAAEEAVVVVEIAVGVSRGACSHDRWWLIRPLIHQAPAAPRGLLIPGQSPGLYDARLLIVLT